jgi:ornithine cyclodeaminase
VELGDVIRGRARGRRAAAEVTICDLTGTGAQDTAIATHVMAKLAGRDVGTVIHT